MAKYGSAHVGVVLVDGYDLLPSKIESMVGPKVTSVFEQTDGLGDEWEEHLPVGVRRAELSQSGWWDDDTGAIQEAFVGQQGVERVVCIGLNGGARGDLFTGIRGAFGGEFERLAVRNGLVKANVTYQINGQVDDDVVIAIAHSAQAADFNSPGVAESAAATTGGLLAYLHIGALDLGGHTGLKITVQHSTALNGSYADKLVVHTVTTGRIGIYAAGGGSVNRFLRVAGDFEGSGNSPSVDIFAGVKRL